MTIDCPDDVIANSSTECRAAAGLCDAPELCSGDAVDCPIDSKLTGTCREATGTCDVTETCDGVNDDCPLDDFTETNGVSCEDNNELTLNDMCQEGTCTGELIPGVCGNAIPVEILPFSESGTIIDRSNTMTAYGTDCWSNTQEASDIVYELTVDDGVEYRIEVVPGEDIDLAVNVIRTCAADQACLGSANDEPAGVSEIVNYLSDENGTVYIVIEGASADVEGEFELIVTTVVPSEDTTGTDTGTVESDEDVIIAEFDDSEVTEPTEDVAIAEGTDTGSDVIENDIAVQDIREEDVPVVTDVNLADVVGDAETTSDVIIGTDNGTPNEGGGGCQGTSTGSSTPMVLLVMMMMVAFVWRRRTRA